MNVNWIMHEFPTETSAPLTHVVPLATEKSEAFVPVIDGLLVMLSDPLPVFATATAIALLVVFMILAVLITNWGDQEPISVDPFVCNNLECRQILLVKMEDNRKNRPAC